MIDLSENGLNRLSNQIANRKTLSALYKRSNWSSNDPLNTEYNGTEKI